MTTEPLPTAWQTLTRMVKSEGVNVQKVKKKMKKKEKEKEKKKRSLEEEKESGVNLFLC